MTRFDAIGVGSPLMDMLAHVEEAFLHAVDGAKGGMELVDHGGMQTLVEQLSDHQHAPGGSAANTIFGMSRLGSRCTFLGKVGSGETGELYKSQASAHGVDTSRFKHCAESATGRCLSLITPDSQRTCRTFLGAAMNLAAEEISVADFANCRHAHIEGYVLFNRELTRRVLECAKEAGCAISLDLASFEVVAANRDILDDILADFVDIVFANEDEAEAYAGSKDPIVGLEALAKLCELAAVKVGPEGAYLRHAGQTVRVHATPVKAVDTTGAGDLWAAGFLHGHLQGWGLANSGALGARLGASVVQQTGAVIPDEEWRLIIREFAG
jgi:sugar/nucleoside kinase (ribokinase family)